MADSLQTHGAERRMYQVAGMNCAGCARRLERTLAAVEGVDGVRVNFAGECAVIDGAANDDTLLDVAVKAGFTLTAQSDELPSGPKAEGRFHAWEWITGLVLSVPLVVEMAGHSIGSHVGIPASVQFLLATGVLAVIGRHFLLGAWHTARAGATNMDTLVAMGMTAAFVWSTIMWLGDIPGMLHFEAVALVLTLVHFGKWLEQRAKAGAGDAVGQLLRLKPDTAKVVSDHGLREVPVRLLVAGEVVRVGAGERVPVDGTVVFGHSELDLAHLTGEPVPVAVSPGSTVAAGGLNLNGTLDIEATSTGRDGAVDRIARMVSESQNARAGLERYSDKVASVLVPVVLAIALATLLGWGLLAGDWQGGIAAAVAVLVIACPCALGLAAPVAIMAGVGAAARRGILIRDLGAVERSSGIRHVVLDKTGTLTEGRPELVDVVTLSGDREAALRLAASAVAAESHPLSRAIRVAAPAGLEKAASVVAVPGKGVRATVGAHAVLVGAPAFLSAEGVDMAPIGDPFAGRPVSQVALAVDGQVAALFALADRARAEAGAAIAALRAEGLEPVIASGDNPAAVAAVAGDLGIANHHGGMTPAEKRDLVARLHADGGVAMVGDGINDAPALAEADLAIAVAGATDIAGVSASMVLMRPDPRAIPESIHVARMIAGGIRQNLFWAFAYNAVALPLAALGIVAPAIAGAAMAGSSVTVVLNALRIGAKVRRMPS
ncbi:MAG: cation-translocating P-type ATPase [Pseudomonadota bacterium]|nr:cation-translocating P-type ATPase [Pseudomonadota bacterium]